MNNPVISCIVPVFKVEQFLQQCIDSILAQTFTDFELILVDDGSPDNSGKICDEYAKKDSRIKVIHKENGGVSSARNVGLDIAKGEWICFVDSDDWVEPEYMQMLYEGALTTVNSISICGLVNQEELAFFSELSKTENTYLEYNNESFVYILERYRNTNFCTNILHAPWCKLYNKKIINNIRFNEDISVFEDFDFNMKIFNNNFRFVYVPRCLYHYRVNDNSITHTLSYKRINDILNAIDLDKKLFDQISIRKKVHYLFAVNNIFTCLYCLVDFENSPEKNELLTQIRNRIDNIRFSSIILNKTAFWVFMYKFLGYKSFYFAFKLKKILQGVCKK